MIIIVPSQCVGSGAWWCKLLLLIQKEKLRVKMECIICEKPLICDDKCVVNNPLTTKGLLSIISAAEKRQDKCDKNILLKRDAILEGKLKVKFHKEYRKGYTSCQNLRLFQSSDDRNLGPEPSSSLSITRRRKSLISEACV